MVIWNLRLSLEQPLLVSTAIGFALWQNVHRSIVFFVPQKWSSFNVAATFGTDVTEDIARVAMFFFP
jgi:hypothetical protein